MNTNLSSAVPSAIETECLVVVVLDKGEKDKPSLAIESGDAAVAEAAKDVIASGEATGKSFETTLLHRPAGLKAKRLLLLGGGKARTFSTSDLRKLAGAAVRTLKGKSIRNFAFVAPETAVPAAEGVRAIVEGALIGSFEPDYYKSDRKNTNKDQKVEGLTIAVQGDTKALQSALDTGRTIGESQNFTRDLVNEPSNRMTPNILADRAKKMASEVGLGCEILGPD
jgi:leucyl aminopeptidase